MGYEVLSVILCLLKVPDRLCYGSVPDVDTLHHPEALCYFRSWDHDLRLCPNLDDSRVLLFVPASHLYPSNSGLVVARVIMQRVTDGPTLGTE